MCIGCAQAKLCHVFRFILGPDSLNKKKRIPLNWADDGWFSSVTFSSAPASWPPAADCYSTPLPLGQRQGKRQRDPAALPASGACQARAPAPFLAQWGPPTSQGTRHGLWTQTSVEQLLSCQLPRLLLCKIPPLRTHIHQVRLCGNMKHQWITLFLHFFLCVWWSFLFLSSSSR